MRTKKVALEKQRQLLICRHTAGVQNATVNFMTQKMIVEFEEGQDAKSVMKDVLKNCKKVEDDCEIYL